MAAEPHSESKAEIRAFAERMSELEKVKSDFLNLASHELRGPLAVLRGYVSMLADGSLGELSPQVKGIVPVLAAKTAEIGMLVNQMLDAARLEDARLQVDLKRLDLRVPVRGAVGIVGGLAKPGQAVLMQGPPRPVWVNGDTARIETIAANLLTNALKFSPDGGPVEVTVRVARGTAVVAVADRGIGVAEEDMPRLFTKFGRLVTPHNSHIQGTGLGLYLSREIARMHGGDITAARRDDGGMHFELHLPVAP